MRSSRSCVAWSRPAVLFELDTGVYGTCHGQPRCMVCSCAMHGGVGAGTPFVSATKACTENRTYA